MQVLIQLDNLPGLYSPSSLAENDLFVQML